MKAATSAKVVIAVWLWFAQALAVGAATFAVTNLADNGAGSLRQTILSASPGDTVNFAVTGLIALTNGELLITNSLTITGLGATNLAVSGNTNSRVFEISSNVTVSISALTLKDGHAGNGTNSSGGSGGGDGSGGGCIWNRGMLTLSNCVLTGNSGGGGGMGYQYGGNGGAGGGVYNESTLTLVACILKGNRGGQGGMGSFAFNSGNGGAGGAIYNAGRLTMSTSIIDGNSGGGGADYYSQPYGSGGGQGGNGGGIWSGGTLILTSCMFSANSGGTGGSGSTISVGGSGGGGGGIYSTGMITAIDCTFAGNATGTGAEGGSAIDPGNGGNGGNGGGILNAGAATLTACTFSGNSCGNGADGGNGVGTYPYLGTGVGGTGGNGGSGGGIYNAPAASLAVLCSTIVAGDSAGVYGSGGYGPFFDGGPGSDGSGPDLAGSFSSQGHNLLGETNGSTGFTNGVNSDLAGTAAAPLDPKLGLLAGNGGLTLTLALLHGSPALDAGDDSLLGPPYSLITDQRGFPRKAGAHVDIGAFEFQPIATPPTLTSLAGSAAAGFQFAFTNTSGATFSVLDATNLSPPLSNWPILGQAPEIAPGQFQFTDLQTTNNPKRFYRVSSP